MVSAGDKIRARDAIPEAYVTEAADTAAITTSETVVGTLTFSAVSGVVYRARFSLQTLQSVAGDYFLYQIREDTVSGTILNAWGYTNGTTAYGQQRTVYLHWTAASTATKTIVVTLTRLSGTGNIVRSAKSCYDIQRIT